MQIQVNAGDIEIDDAVVRRVNDEVESALKHVRDQVTRVEVHLRDDNRDKGGGNDKRCTIEARIAGQQPLAVEQSGADLTMTIAEAAKKLRRAVHRNIDRRDQR